MQCTVGQSLIGLLEAQGVRQVFGIPGVHNLELYRGLARSRIRHVAARHEQGLGFMADGYARSSGQPGVCFTITGPGLTNIATALGQAYGDSIPVLVIASGSHRRESSTGRGFLHEMADQLGVAARVTGYARRIEAAAELPDALRAAFSTLGSGRPRPAYLEIPRDLLGSEATRAAAEPVYLATPPILSAAARAQLEAIAQRLGRASRPVLIVGGGARRAASEVCALAERVDAPTVMTVNARGVLSAGHPLEVPASPSLKSVRALIAAADCVLAVGTEFGPTDFDMYSVSDFPQPGGLMRIDIDESQLTRSVQPEIGVVADAGAALQWLIESAPEPSALRGGARRAAETRRDALAELSPAMRAQVNFLHTLRDAVPEAVMVGDSTQPVYAGNLYFEARQPGTWFNSATGFGSLGYALPAANGASLATATRPVICLVGDGGLQFTLGELATARDLNAHLLIMVWNNRGYREIRQAMLAVGIEPEGVDVRPPELEALAQAYGVAYRRAGSLAELAEAAAAFNRQRQVMLLEILAEHFE